MPLPLIVAAVTGGATAGASIYGAKKQSSTANTAARYQSDAANRAAELEARSSERALAFAREQEAARQREYAATQALNERMWREQFTADQALARDQLAASTALGQGRLNLDRTQWDTRIKNLSPYRQFGYGSLGQIAQPIPRRAPGSIGAMAGA